MGVLVLVLGDFHIPHRAAEVPAKYREMITPNKINTVICTGNMGSGKSMIGRNLSRIIFMRLRGISKMKD